MASAAASPKVSAPRDGTSATAARARSAASVASSTRPAKRTSAARAAARASSSARSGPSPATTSGSRARAQASIATSTPFSGASRATTSACSPAAASERAANSRTTWPTTRTRPASTGARRTRQPRQRGGAGDDDRVGRRDHPALPERERRRVDGALGAVAAAVRGARPGSVSRPWQRVQSSPRLLKHVPTAQTSRKLCRCSTTRAPVGAGRRQRAPAEGGQEVVGVHDPRAGAADRVGDLLRAPPAAQEPRGGAARGRCVGAVALEELDLLAEVLAREPGEVADDALLPAGDAVAVVQDEDHAGAEASLSGGHGPRAAIIVPTRGRPSYLDVALRSLVPAGRRGGRRAARRRSTGPTPPRRPSPRRHGARAGRPRRAARPQRRAQHRGRRAPTRSCWCSSTTTSRCARAGWPRSWPPTPSCRAPTACSPARPRPLRGPPAARVRA